MAEMRAAQREDTVGKGEVTVAFNRLPRVSNGLFRIAGEKARQRQRECGVITERFQRAEVDRLLGLLDGLVIGSTEAPRYGVEAEDNCGIGIDHCGTVDSRKRQM